MSVFEWTVTPHEEAIVTGEKTQTEQAIALRKELPGRLVVGILCVLLAALAANF